MSRPAARGAAPARGSRRGDTAEAFRLMADSAPVMIWVAGPDRRCVYVNRPWLDFTGRGLEEELGEGWMQRVHPDDREPLGRAQARGIDERSPFEAEFRLRRHDGCERWILAKGAPLLSGDRLSGYIGWCFDITARRAAEEREREARASAESATLARDQFLAVASHELRSPLNGIKSWTHVLEQQLAGAPPLVRRALAGIMLGVEQQVRLIDDLLDVTRAVSGNLGLAAAPMALAPAVADAVESQRALAAQKGLRLVVEEALGEARIQGDADRIRQVVVNLLANAIKFTPAGGTVRVRAVAEGGEAHLEVADDGEGIAPEFLPYVFDPFRQADQGSSRRRQQGLGLGLALVHRLVELHGGRATCESEGPGRGATLRVALPLLREPAGPPAALPLERPGAATALPSLAGIRVLVIDDQPEARESLSTLLGLAGAQVATAASGDEALDRIAAEGEDPRPQVIVCDIAMPGEDGYAVLRRIRRWESRPGAGAGRHRPAIALSACAQREDRLRALAEGFLLHLAKPVAPVQLGAEILRLGRAGP